MNNKKGFFTLLLVFVVILAAAGLLYAKFGDMPMADQLAVQTTPPPAQDSGAETELHAAPDFTVYDGDDNAVHLSDFKGKPVVLNFWASWCGPCKMEMPDFEAKSRELEGDVVFMMVNATDGGRETVDTAKQFVADSGYTFPVYYDTEYSAIYAYGVNAFPTTFFIDAEGNLVAYGQGAMSGETLQTGIDMIFAG